MVFETLASWDMAFFMRTHGSGALVAACCTGLGNETTAGVCRLPGDSGSIGCVEPECGCRFWREEWTVASAGADLCAVCARGHLTCARAVAWSCRLRRQAGGCLIGEGWSAAGLSVE